MFDEGIMSHKEVFHLRWNDFLHKVERLSAGSSCLVCSRRYGMRQSELHRKRILKDVVLMFFVFKLNW